MDAVPGLERRLSLRAIDTHGSVGGGFDTVQTWETIYAHDLPGVATFFVRGSKLDLPPTLGTQWKTREWKP
jgi:hypothetical protein